MTIPPARVLAAVDGSVPSLQAARVATELAASWKARVRVVAVGGAEGVGRVLDAQGSPGPPARERKDAQLKDVLDYVCRLCAEAGVEADAVLRPASGEEPYEGILREAEAWGADLLVLGRSGHRGLGRALLGSQAEHVLEFARLPVVVVPESPRAHTQGPLPEPRLMQPPRSERP